MFALLDQMELAAVEHEACHLKCNFYFFVFGGEAVMVLVFLLFARALLSSRSRALFILLHLMPTINFMLL